MTSDDGKCPGLSEAQVDQFVTASCGRREPHGDHVPQGAPREALLRCGCPPWSDDGHQVGPGCPAYDGPRDARMDTEGADGHV